MLRKLLFFIGFLLTTNALVFAQSGALKGKIFDKTTKEPIAFANVIVENGGTLIGGTQSDFDGNFTIKPITPGKYDVKATYVGYKNQLIKGMVINSDKITFMDIEMESTSVALETFEVKDYKVPLISKDKTSTGGTVTSDEIAKMPNRSADAVATTVGGVFSADGERGSVRGARTEGTVMYIDGMRVRGSNNLPQSAIEEVTVITGGLPAQYGDATGGVINVTTKGPSRKFGAGIELQTSELLDNYGYNRVGFNMQGPLIKMKNKKDSLNPISLLGYFLAGDITYSIDGRPSSAKLYKVKDDVLDYLIANPLRPAGLTSGGTYKNADFVRKSDLEQIKHTLNTENLDVSLSAKLDVRTTPTINLSIGGSMNYTNYKAYDFTGSLMNYDNNAQVINSTWRVFARFTQRFPAEKENKALIKNIYYTLQADYTQFNQTVQDATHKDKLFNYGYVGKFTSHRAKTYELGSDSVNGHYYQNVWLQTGYRDTLYSFTPSTANPELANYTSYYNSLYKNNVVGHLQNPVQYQLGGALLNGEGPESVYGLWQTPGTQYNGYSVSDNSQIGINLNANADIGNHAFQFGIQYEQRTDRYYGYAPVGFWTLIDPRTGLVNKHISQSGDKQNGQLVTLNGVFQDTINYPDLVDISKQSFFDYNLRKKLFNNTTGSEWIDVDSYDPSVFSVDMFSADELLNSGRSLVSYYGYDYTGKKLTKKPTFSDFFTAKDEYGNYKREVGAYEPIYLAGYIQDKFAFSDLIFNIGLRVDRFDANQLVLKDPYLLYEAKTVKEVTDPSLGTHPSNMGEDYVVYVDNAVNPTKITGYRNGSKWYSATGTEIPDPDAYGLGTNNPPALLNPGDKTIKQSAFKDYEPQTNFLPRVSFSFPINEEALFFAHYDVLTQRPTSSVRFDPTDYLFLETIGTTFINNPNLRSSKTIDYEVGFQQKLSNSSSLNLSAFYREMRNQIQAYFYAGAYPKPYYSFNNIDFGTVKGLIVTYDLRRTTNARIRASYTLQFADGTGSDNASAAALVLSNEPKLRNLRTTFPVDYDRRHALNLVFDFRYDEGTKYNGPRITRHMKDGKTKTTNLLENAGLSITFNGGSGTPYSRSSRAGFLGGSNILIGSVNGSRLPWQFRMDARVDKDFVIEWGKPGKKKHQMFMNAYFEILNVLNSQNIMSVYRATGNPDDDGYLASPQAQPDIAIKTDSQAFIDLYKIRIDGPGQYSLPRRIRFGVSLSF